MSKVIDDYMNEVIIYGGMPVRRYDVHRHLMSVGCGPQSVAYAGYMSPDHGGSENGRVVDAAPMQRWDEEAGALVWTENGPGPAGKPA